MIPLTFPPPSKSPSDDSDGVLLSPSTASTRSSFISERKSPVPAANNSSLILSDSIPAIVPPVLKYEPITPPPQKPPRAHPQTSTGVPIDLKPRLPKFVRSNRSPIVLSPPLPTIVPVTDSAEYLNPGPPSVVSSQGEIPKKTSTFPNVAAKPRLPKIVRVSSNASSSSVSTTPVPMFIPPFEAPGVNSSSGYVPPTGARGPQLAPLGGWPPAPPSPVWGWAAPSPWSAPPPPPPMPPLYRTTKHHDRFFFADGNVAFQTWDGTIYKVHRYHFNQHSTILSGMIPSYTYPNPESLPVHLHDIDPRAFELLLSIFYPKDFLCYELETVSDWSKLLSIANKYSMTKIKNLAIDRLGSIATPVDKIALANDYDIQEWLIPAFTELCLRDEPLTFEEGIQLGVDAIVKIGQLKYEITDNLRQYVDDSKVRKAVEDSLGDDMNSETSY